MFNDIFIHKGEVWTKLRYSCKLPFMGFVDPEVPIRMSEENFKILASKGYPISKIPMVKLYISELGKYYYRDVLVKQKIDPDSINIIEKKAVVQIIEPQQSEPTIESVIPEKCVPELSSVGDMLEKQIAKDKKVEENELVEFEEDVLVEEEELEEDEKPISRNDINRMKKADLHKLLDYLEVEYTEEMVVRELRELALELLGL